MSQSILSTVNSLGADSSNVVGLLPIIDSATALSGIHSSNRSTVLLLLQQCGSSIAMGMISGQYPVQSIQSQFRLSVSVLDAGSTLQNISLSLPQSSLELASGQEASAISIPDQGWNSSSSSSSSSESKITATSVSIRSASSLPAQNGLYLSNPVVVTFSSLPCLNSANTSSCVFDFHLPNTNGVSTKSVSNTSDGVFTTCKKGSTHNLMHNCSNGHKLIASCNGSFEGVLHSLCPIISLQTICSTYYTTLGSCVVHSNSSGSTVCRCLILPGDHRRRLQQSDESRSIGSVTILTSITKNMRETITSADSLSGDKISKQVTVLITIGLLALSILAALVAGHWADNEESVNKPSRKSGKIMPLLSAEKKTWRGSNGVRVRNGQEDSSQSGLAVFEDALPQVFSSKPFSQRLYNEMKHHHKWLGVVFYYSESLPRSLRVLAIATKIVLMLFMQSISYDYTNPDDGSCEKMTNRVDCLQAKSSLSLGEDKCKWENESCSFIQPSESFAVVLYVAVFCTVLSTPIAFVLNKIILGVLAMPLRDSAVAPAVQSVDEGKVESKWTSKSPDILSQLEQLNEDVQIHRKKLDPELRKEFDGKLFEICEVNNIYRFMVLYLFQHFGVLMQKDVSGQGRRTYYSVTQVLLTYEKEFFPNWHSFPTRSRESGHCLRNSRAPNLGSSDWFTSSKATLCRESVVLYCK